MTQNPDDPGASSQALGPVGSGDYTVKQGDCISSIAKTHGHFWKTVWNHPDNADLKAARKDPNVLLPGDKLTIPPISLKQETRQTDMRHKFVRKGEPAKLCLRILEFDNPRANENYTINIDGSLRSGTTDADGYLKVSIPGNARRAELVLTKDGKTYDFELGGIDPITEISGVQGRLNNLGYGCGLVDNVLGPRTRLALRRFQAAKNLPETGEPNQQTRSRLQQEHGG